MESLGEKIEEGDRSQRLQRKMKKEEKKIRKKERERKKNNTMHAALT